MKTKLTDLFNQANLSSDYDLGELLYDIEVESTEDIERELDELDYDGRVHEKIDSQIDIYYNHILKSLDRDDVKDAMSECISEGLFDPSHGYDLYKHIQCAQYVVYRRDIYEELETIKKQLVEAFEELEGNENN